MSYQLSSDLVTRIQTFVVSGGYASEEEVVQDALLALEQRQQDLIAIRAGIADMEAGRCRPFSEIECEFRTQYQIPTES
jgi:Arc/MetJ-type ribon-helix-helix transcriptional regulator